MEHCVKIGTFGLNRKHVLGRVQKGDKVACYVTREHKIIALGKTISDYYMDDKKVFKADGVFPDRFDFTATLLKPEEEVDFKSMVDDLTFINNKYYWSVYFRSGITGIPEQDWQLITQKLPVATFN